MKNLDSVMATPAEMPSELVRDNFLKLNRIFKSEFLQEFGTIETSWQHMAATPVTVSIAFSRIGRQISLQWDDIRSTLKANTKDPFLAAALPDFLRPPYTVNFTCWGSASAGDELMFGEITAAGILTIYSHSGWTAAAYAEIYGSAITYLGS